ncbi:GNAT family N-acetyltransferase [Streptococcus merionis]|uniref:Acetyltransferase n=1 Tax=Streptococcus merionis TaxID=400065 RepID=A0A239STG0_9STRE|nr:GNAT family N-acetyltransferase [Streptococcus merionis]SNU88128.1 acetyltransferase [Streptococcus merionis]
MNIIPYSPEYEKSWVYTKALSHLFSPFFDDMPREKEQMNTDIYQDQIDLIAVECDQVVGLLTINIFHKTISQSYRYYPADKVAYFENLAVHPDYQNQGIASQLFEEAERQLKAKEVDALAIFTRDGASANHLYQKWGGQLIAQDYLVVGNLKTEEPFTFEVLSDEGRLRFSRNGQEIPYYQREGIYVVSKEEDIDLFDIEAVYHEKTYIKTYENSEVE